MSIFSKSISYEEITEVVKNKVEKTAYKGETITRYEVLQYLYNYYSSKRGSLDFHLVIDVIDKFFVAGEIRP